MKGITYTQGGRVRVLIIAYTIPASFQSRLQLYAVNQIPGLPVSEHGRGQPAQAPRCW